MADTDELDHDTVILIATFGNSFFSFAVSLYVLQAQKPSFYFIHSLH